MPAVSKSSPPEPLGVVGKLFGSLFLGVFLAAGLGFFVMLGSDIAKSLAPWLWTKTDCVITESSVRPGSGDDAGVWYAEIKYRFNDPETGRPQTGSRVRSNGTGQGNGFSDAAAAQRTVRQFPADSRAQCYARGGDAVLLRQTPFVALTLLFPLIFVAIGGGGIYFLWRPRAEKPKSKALSNQPAAARGILLARGFFLLFFLIGAALSYGLFLKPMWKIVQAKSWPAIPCTIVRSDVKTHSDSDGDTHSVDIHYRYEIAGESLDSNRYSFFGGSSSGYQGKRAIADRYKAGSRATCFVNPSDPLDAVLVRGFVGELWFGVIPAVFCAVGLGGMIYVKRSGGVTAVAAFEAGSVTLKPRASPVGKFVVGLIVALVCNGIVTVMFVFGREIPWWFKGFFALAGAGIFSGVVYQFLALFNPRPILTVNRQAVPLGGEFTLDWRLVGNVRRIQRLHLFLRGTEEATYRRGTDTTTDKHTFTEIELFNDTDPTAFITGQASVTIPANSMHTFTAPNNKIVWSLHVKGDIPRWPDVDEEFPVTVLPQSANPS